MLLYVQISHTNCALQITSLMPLLPGPRGEAAASGLPGMDVVGEGTCGTRVTPVTGIL